MMRLAELILLLAPIAAYAGWRVFAPGRVPSAAMIVTAAVLLTILAGSLVWLRAEDAEPPDSIYIPQHLEDGKIIPGRSVPK